MRALTVHHVSVNVADLDEGSSSTAPPRLPRRGDRPGDIGPVPGSTPGPPGPPAPAPAPESRGQHFALLWPTSTPSAPAARRRVQVSEPFRSAEPAGLPHGPWGNVIELTSSVPERAGSGDPFAGRTPSSPGIERIGLATAARSPRAGPALAPRPRSERSSALATTSRRRGRRRRASADVADHTALDAALAELVADRGPATSW